MASGIYVHLPFCAVHCTYCDFPLTTRLSLADRYYAALLKEIETNRPAETTDTLYFGGGTPSLTPPSVLKRIMNQFTLLSGSEVTLEANPDDINADALAGWQALGITRLSIGVQSLEEPVLHWMLRRHSPDQGRAALIAARTAGFENRNIDLMIGCPYQTADGFFAGLKELIEFHPEHFSLYLLEIHENSALQKQLQASRVQLMPEEEQLHCFTEAICILEKAGYQHYEVSNFALPGRESKHNLKYWTNCNYHAFGAGASAYLRPVRTTNIRSIAAYIAAVEEGRQPIESRIVEDKETETRNALIFGLRKTEGINIPDFEKHFGISPVTLFGPNADLFLRERLLEVRDMQLRLTPAGMLVSNEVLSSAV